MKRLSLSSEIFISPVPSRSLPMDATPLLHRCFSLLDEDGNRFLSLRELNRFMVALQVNHLIIIIIHHKYHLHTWRTHVISLCLLASSQLQPGTQDEFVQFCRETGASPDVGLSMEDFTAAYSQTPAEKLELILMTHATEWSRQRSAGSFKTDRLPPLSASSTGASSSSPAGGGFFFKFLRSVLGDSGSRSFLSSLNTTLSSSSPSASSSSPSSSSMAWLMEPKTNSFVEVQEVLMVLSLCCALAVCALGLRGLRRCLRRRCGHCCSGSAAEERASRRRDRSDALRLGRIGSTAAAISSDLDARLKELTDMSSAFERRVVYNAGQEGTKTGILKGWTLPPALDSFNGSSNGASDKEEASAAEGRILKCHSEVEVDDGLVA